MLNLPLEKKKTKVDSSSETVNIFDAMANLAKTEEINEDSENQRKISKQLSNLTQKLEDIENQIYHLQQRLEVVERKLEVNKFNPNFDF